MAINPLTVLQLAAAAKGLYDSFKGGGGKNAGVDKLKQIMQGNPAMLERLLKMVESTGTAQAARAKSNIAARGINPSGAIGRAEDRAVQASLPVRQGAITAGFRAGSQGAQLAAASQLAGQPTDNTGSDLITSAVKNYITARADGQDNKATNTGALDNQSPVSMDDIKAFGGFA